MGDIAEMMLEGFLCEGCGEWMGDEEGPGYPVRCVACQPKRREPDPRKILSTTGLPCGVRVKDVKWLHHCAAVTGLYPGQHYDFVPDGPRGRLLAAGLLERFTPPNPAHKDRLVATDRGREVLATQAGAQP